MANVPRELFRLIRSALVEILKEATDAGQRVSTGRAIPLNDPFAPITIPSEEMPLIIVSAPQINFDNTGLRGSRKQHRRNCQFQIDGWLKHDFTAAQFANQTLDEELEKRRDDLADQIITEIEKNNRFQFTGAIENKVEMWLINSIPNDYTDQTEGQALIATVSITINAMYDQDVVTRDTDTLSIMSIVVKDDGSIEKELQVP